jgi:prephenate dehydratase
VTGVRVAFLGPEASFTAEAANRVAPDAERRAAPTIPHVFDLVRGGEAGLGIVPIENLIEGSVNVTLDELAFGAPGVYIRGELLTPVSMNLLVRPGTTLAAVKRVRSHPQGLGQCRGWLAANLPGVEVEAATSTAEAARAVAEEPEDRAAGSAAIAPQLAAERYGLAVLARDIQDHPDNVTRFAVLGRRMAAATGADKTSLVVFFGEDRPGLLLRILDEFALRGINLTKIESRPAKTTMGEYCILIDCEGHPADARLAEALRSVHRHVAELKVLGAYPRADALPPKVGPSDTDRAYAEAHDWYGRILAEVDDAPPEAAG